MSRHLVSEEGGVVNLAVNEFNRENKNPRQKKHRLG